MACKLCRLRLPAEKFFSTSLHHGRALSYGAKYNNIPQQMKQYEVKNNFSTIKASPIVISNRKTHQYSSRHYFSTDQSTPEKTSPESHQEQSSDSTASQTSSENINASENVASENTASDGSNGEESGEYSSVGDIRKAILTASLDHVQELGWTKEAIAAGASSLGYSPMAHGLAEGGGAELFLHLLQTLNDGTESHLREITGGSERPSSSAIIEEGINFRLDKIAAWRPLFPRGMAALATHPPSAPQGLKVAGQLADILVHHAGDKSTGITWYTQRGAIAGIYASAELHLLQDDSPDHIDTRDFVHRCLKQLTEGVTAADCLRSATTDGAKLAKAAVKTGLNMAGLNRFSR